MTQAQKDLIRSRANEEAWHKRAAEAEQRASRFQDSTEKLAHAERVIALQRRELTRLRASFLALAKSVAEPLDPS